MRPSRFPEENDTLLAPMGWPDDKCEDLPIHRTGQDIVSLWRPTWRERLSMLVFGRVWVHFVKAGTHPPVALSARREYFSRPTARTIYAEWRKGCGVSQPRGGPWRCYVCSSIMWKAIFRAARWGRW